MPVGILLLTAWRAIHWWPARPGETLLVAGGAGAIGHYAGLPLKLCGA
jgi:NADPH:quinone reductase-like Zn-dependent oxidoreductase